MKGLRLLAIAAALTASIGDAPAADALAFMHGTWQGDGQILVLDTRRLLANLDPAKPFQREPLILQNITDGMVVFSIGNRRFIGLFDGDTLSLTGEGMPQTLRLQRMN